ncbi:phosphotransferase [Nocardioides yefusunii]|uniref:Phosphotransferase n=1 Tax=Nocardioides yefusunii TaxID=2500546 RepID=A0ABW1QYI4_9ACTN|nr:phosphotransferase [Nocardioides yefusunii]
MPTSFPPYPVPPLDSARRLEWAHLPPLLRDRIEQRCGAPVLGAESIEAGFTPGMASVLTCADGSQHFVKVASHRAQASFAASYAEELARLRQLPPDAPAPALLWSQEDDEWVVFATEFVDAEPVARPWSLADLEACLDSLAEIAERFTPAPAAMNLPTFADETAAWAGAWRGLTPPTSDENAAELAAEAAVLARRARDLLVGETLVHGDLRADDVLLPPDSAALFCDWNWPARGPEWLDSYMLLVAARGDGVDVDAVIADRPLLASAPAEAVDSLLALMAGYFVRAGCGSVPPNSPHVRDHQYWTGSACWQWLADRRGW